MTSAFQKYRATNPQSLKCIEVVIYENAKLPDFLNEIVNLSQTSSGVAVKPYSHLTSAIPAASRRSLDARANWNAHLEKVELYEKLKKARRSPQDGASSYSALKVSSVSQDVSKQSERFSPAMKIAAKRSLYPSLPVQGLAASLCSITIDLCSNNDKNIEEVRIKILHYV